ncbi:unnamed protein product, partial [Discosporangium mesarthrocarpum]
MRQSELVGVRVRGTTRRLACPTLASRRNGDYGSIAPHMLLPYHSQGHQSTQWLPQGAQWLLRGQGDDGASPWSLEYGLATGFRGCMKPWGQWGQNRERGRGRLGMVSAAQGQGQGQGQGQEQGQGVGMVGEQAGWSKELEDAFLGACGSDSLMDLEGFKALEDIKELLKEGLLLESEV